MVWVYPVENNIYSVDKLSYMVWTTSMLSTPYIFLVVHTISPTPYDFGCRPHHITHVVHTIKFIWTTNSHYIVWRIFDMVWGCRFHTG